MSDANEVSVCRFCRAEDFYLPVIGERVADEHREWCPDLAHNRRAELLRVATALYAGYPDGEDIGTLIERAIDEARELIAAVDAAVEEEA